MPNAAIVVCMDASDSMRFYNYFQPAQTDAATFVNIMQVGDSLGVTAFSDNAWIAYPSSSASVALVQSQNDLTSATTAIMALKTVSMTNMSAALSTSAGMLTNAANPKAIVMLSDGDWNRGTDPRLNLPSMKVFTIALGNNGQVATMQAIASGTGGTFHLAPTPFDLSDIYNEIIGQTQIATVVANQKRNVNQNSFWLLPATVAQGAAEVTFSVTWTNWTITYTSGTPVGNQVNVTLQNPSGGTVAATPTAIGNGFVVFKLQNPQAGTWQAAIWSSAGGTLGTAGGVFDPQLGMQMHVEAPMNARVGRPVALKVQVREADGSVVPNAHISASVEMPSMEPEQAVKNNRDRLDALPPPQVSGEDSDNVRMLGLQMQLGPGELLLPYDQMPLFAEIGQGSHGFAFTPKHKGGHIVRLHAHGHAPLSKRDFSLARRISIWADHG
jgi:Ca-activated chloride channel homolog